MAILLTRKILRTLPNLQTLSLTKPSITHPLTTQVVLTNLLLLNCEALKHLRSVSRSTPVLECLQYGRNAVASSFAPAQSCWPPHCGHIVGIPALALILKLTAGDV